MQIHLTNVKNICTGTWRSLEDSNRCNEQQLLYSCESNKRGVSSDFPKIFKAKMKKSESNIYKYSGKH